MRAPLGWTAITLAAFVACGSDESKNQPLADAGSGSDGGVSDGGVRPDDSPDADVLPDAADGDAPVPRGFQIQSKDVTVQPSQEVTYCYYFTTPNTETLAIHKWKSAMTPGVRSMALFIGGTDGASGTISAICPSIKNASVSNSPVWAYASYEADGELAFPSDDGTGKPLGFELPPGKPAYLVMHHVNATSQPITAHVTLNAEALPEGVAFTKTSTFVTYNDDLAIPANSTNFVASKTCDTLPDTRFWFMSMHTHKQAVRTTVKNGTSASSNIAYDSADWADPVQKTWPANPFYAFDPGKLTFECAYTNPTNRTITSGDGTTTDEKCMVTSYYFPATKPVLCFCPEALSGCVAL